MSALGGVFSSDGGTHASVTTTKPSITYYIKQLFIILPEQGFTYNTEQMNMTFN